MASDVREVPLLVNCPISMPLTLTFANDYILFFVLVHRKFTNRYRNVCVYTYMYVCIYLFYNNFALYFI